MGKFKSMKPGGSNFRPKPPTPKNKISPNILPIHRPAMTNPIRGASVNRVIAREIRRNAFQQVNNQTKVQPRFVVRPENPVVKIMPKIPQPVTVVKKPSPIRPKTSHVLAQEISIKPPNKLVSTQSTSAKMAAKPPITSTMGSRQRATKGIYPVGIAIGATTLSSLIVNVAAANPQISTEVNSLNSSLEDIKSRSSLNNVVDEMNQLDTNLTHAMDLLEGARQEGYVYQKDLEEIAYNAMDQWQGIKQELLGSVPQQAETFQRKMLLLGDQLARLNSLLGNSASVAPVLRDTTSQVNTLSGELTQIENTLENKFAEIRSQTAEITSRLNLIHWSMDQLSQAKYNLGETENLIHAVQARWDQKGDQDPEGVLYLTNKRILFEQKEKVATKKILFIATAKELVQEVLIDQHLEAISNEKAIHKGLFGNQDFLDVTFSDPKLGNVSFHLNGQDCNLWISWIQKVKSGEIDKERTTGSRISFADFSGPLTTADLLAIQTDVNSLQDVIMLRSIKEELSKIENDIGGLERSLTGLRSRGYVIEKNLEADIKILASQWDRIKTNADLALQNQTRLLGEQMSQIQQNLSILASKSSNLNEARPLFMQIKSQIASIEAQADASDDTVIVTYDQYADEVEAISAHLEWVGWMLDALSTASFKLLATESGIAATEAVWNKTGAEPENGILFLTDQRLLWEDRDNDYELKVDLPLQQITRVRQEVESDGDRESLVFELTSSAPYSTMNFSFGLPVTEAWIKMIGRARSGEYTLDRAIEIDPKEIERIRNAPRQCSNCGAGFTAPLLRGQTEISCEYCGQVTRI
jgi:hypothetical protein